MDGCFEAHGTRRDMSRFLSPERWKSQFGDARGVARARRGAKETVRNGRKRTVSVFLCLDIADAGGAVSALHNPVLDIKCDQDDFMDTAIGA